MVSGPSDENQPAAAPPEAVTTARSEFLQSLGRRLEFIRNLLESVGKDPDSGERQASAQRRLHALKAAAQVLGFEGLGSALTEIEAQVSVPLDSAAAEALVRRLELLPSLVLSSGSGFRSDQSGQFRAVQAKSSSYPMHALVFASPPLAESLRSELAFSGGQPLECERTESLMRARSIALEQAPDVILVDYDRPNAKELLELLLNDAEVEVAPIVVVGSFDSPEAASGLARLGVSRVLPKPVSPSTLRATVLDVFGTSALKPTQARGFGELSVEKLAQRVASELEEGLRGTVDPATVERLVNLGDGAEVLAAVWGAIARIREVVTVRSGGQVRFDPRGPEGAIHVAPWMSSERRAGDRAAGGRVGDDVSLDGRLILVADDDPVVTWFISGLLRSAGARVMEAHDGKRALELCQRHWPDALVSDILMPELDGFRLCRAVKGDIAVRDVPVILLSWKEDMLQRVRELGAGADGYLKKEADGSLVVQRLREVLRPRSRIEARLATSGEVKGRLGDITPRLVLQLACKRQQNVQVSVRDAVYLYEIEIRRGKPVSATRTSDDGASTRGRAVISALLGVSAGRFAVRPHEAETQRDFEHDLFGVLDEPIRLARGARSALAGGRLFEVDQVALDPAVLDAYMRATPDSARDIARRVAQGVPVRKLVSEGVDVSLIEAVLLDLAQHGGVRAIVTAKEGDLLPRAALSMQGVTATGEPPPVMEHSAPPQFTLTIEPSSLPPEVDLEPVLDVADVPLLGSAPVAPAAVPADNPVPSEAASGAAQAEPDAEAALSREDEAEIADVLMGLSEHPPSVEADSSEPAAKADSGDAAPEAGEAAGDPADDDELPPVRKLAFGPAATQLSAGEEARAAVELAKASAAPEPAASAAPPAASEAAESSAASDVVESSARAASEAAESSAPAAKSVADDLAEQSFADVLDEQSFAGLGDEPDSAEPGSAGSVLEPTASSPRVVPRPVLDLSKSEGTQPLGSQAPQRAGGTAGKTSEEPARSKPEPTEAEVQRALGLTAPLPPIRELSEASAQSNSPNADSHDDQASAADEGASSPNGSAGDSTRSLRSELMSGLAKRAPIDGASPEIKAVVMPKAGLKSTLPGVGGAAKSASSEGTAPLPPTKAIDFGVEAGTADAAPELEAVHSSVPSELLPVVRPSAGVTTQLGLGNPRDAKPAVESKSGPQEGVGELQALARAASTPAPKPAEPVSSQATGDKATETSAAKAAETSAAKAAEAQAAAEQAQAKQAAEAKAAADATKAAEAKAAADAAKAAEAARVDAEAAEANAQEAKAAEEAAKADQPAADAARDAGAQPPSKPVESKASRYDEPRVRRIDKGPMPRLEDETPAALASGDHPRGTGPKWLRNVGTVGAAAAAGLVAYFGVRVLMGPVVAETGGAEVPAAAAEAPADVPTVQPAAAKPAEAKKPAGPTISTSFGAAPSDITLDADKGLLELNTGARHSIYVDGVFVGRGPRRRVPLGIGKHDVRLKLDDAELTHEVEVQAARTTQLEVSGGEDESPAKP